MWMPLIQKMYLVLVIHETKYAKRNAIRLMKKPKIYMKESLSQVSGIDSHLIA